MQILVISDAWYPQINGVVRTYEGIMPALAAKGHAMTVIGPADCGWNIPCPNYSEIRLSLGGLFTLPQKIDQFRATCAPEEFHLHIATEGPLGWIARQYAIKNNLIFSSCYHTEFPDYIAKRVPPACHHAAKKWMEQVIRTFHSSAGTMFVATQSLHDRLKKLDYKIPLSFLTRGVDHDQFYLAPKTRFQDVAHPVALYVGRVAIEKNLESFLSAPWQGSKVIVGDGPDLPMLKNKYPDVIFVGKQQGDDLADHFRSADLFVFPSKTDTFGMVLVEALACGLPVAAYPVTGPIDIITEPALGTLDEDLSKAMMTALHSPMNATYRAEHASAHYSWDKVADQFIDAIQRYCPTASK